MKLHSHMLVALLSLILTVPAALAQEPGTSTPPSGQLPTTSPPQGQEPAAEEPTNAPVPDTRPLTGAEEIGVGLRGGSRNYIFPALQVYAYGDSNRTIATSGQRGTELTGSVVGRLALRHASRRSQSTLDYMGGGIFYAHESDLNATIHQIGVSQAFTGRRWALELIDRASYLPESSFGFGGFGSLGGGLSGGFGSGLGRLNPAFSADQTIVTGRGYRINNTTIAQVQYLTSQRASLTATAGYSLLRFVEAGAIDSDNRIFAVGYNYAMTRRDSLGLTYGVSMFRFRGSDLAFDDHFVQLAYGRRVTGRLAFELAAGPQLDIFKNSLAGSTRRYFWNLHSSLRYRWPRSDLDISYGRYTSSGSGLLYGAQTDRLSLSVGHRFTRNWSGSFSPGYAHNSRLQQTTGASTPADFNSYYLRFGLRRSLGRYADASVNYTFQGQKTDISNPLGVMANSTLNRHTFGVAFSWHGRQLGMD
jgi:hypothetical protein